MKMPWYCVHAKAFFMMSEAATILYCNFDIDLQAAGCNPESSVSVTCQSNATLGCPPMLSKHPVPSFFYTRAKQLTPLICPPCHGPPGESRHETMPHAGSPTTTHVHAASYAVSVLC